RAAATGMASFSTPSKWLRSKVPGQVSPTRSVVERDMEWGVAVSFHHGVGCVCVPPPSHSLMESDAMDLDDPPGAAPEPPADLATAICLAHMRSILRSEARIEARELIA